MEIDFSQFEDDIKNNFYSDDFAHLSDISNFGIGKADRNGNYQNLFANEFDNIDSDSDSETFDFI